MPKNRYSMSFTTGTLLHQESLTLANLFEELGNWDAVREQVIEGNLLQMRTLNAAKRVYREIASRLKQLTPAEQALLLKGTRPEQNHMLWLAVCKRYRFIHDFATEVLHEKFLRLDLALATHEYDVFFQDKAEWHPEVARVAESTRKKQRQFLFKMMQQAELLTSDHQIVPALLAPHEVETIVADDRAHLSIYPVSLVQLEEWLS